MNLGRFQEAVIEYCKFLSAMPNSPDVLNKIGYALAHMGKLDEAIEYFNQAIKVDPSYTAARNNLNPALAEKQKLKNKNAENTKK